MDQSLASFVAPVGQEEYYVFLTFSQEKHLHFQEKVRKSQEKILGRMCMNPVKTVLYESMYSCHILKISKKMLTSHFCG